MDRELPGDDPRTENDDRIEVVERRADEPTLRGAGSRLAELGVFLVAVIGAIALGLGISAYLRERPYVVAYLVAYAGFRIADVMLDEGDREARDRARPRWRRELAILALFAAAPFERTYVYGGEAPEGAAALGLLMELAGLWLVIGSRVQLRMGAGRAGNVLVRSGFYRYVRHPVRAGAMLVLFAWPFVYGAPISAAVAFAVLLFTTARAIRREEAAMLARFGAEYKSYVSKTERLIPSVW